MSEVRHLVLVGLMGAGKSRIGAQCARRLDRPFVDTDAIVEATTGTTIADLFATAGEDEFRRRESEAVSDACSSPEPSVIACGGGAVLDPENRRRMRATGFVVWLRAEPAVLAQRVGTGAGRPLLSADPEGTLARLASTREPAYEAVADIAVPTDGQDPDAVTDAVLNAFAAREPVR